MESKYKTKEKIFVEKFIGYMTSKGVSVSAPEKASNQSTYADCEMLHGKIIIRMEAKLFDDSQRNSGEFHKMLGELIAIRNKESLFKKNKESRLGVLIPKDREEYFVKCWHKLSNIDARKYCEAFSLEYLILFDEMKKKCSIKLYQTEENIWKEVFSI